MFFDRVSRHTGILERCWIEMQDLKEKCVGMTCAGGDAAGPLTKEDTALLAEIHAAENLVYEEEEARWMKHWGARFVDGEDCALVLVNVRDARALTSADALWHSLPATSCFGSTLAPAAAPVRAVAGPRGLSALLARNPRRARSAVCALCSVLNICRAGRAALDDARLRLASVLNHKRSNFGGGGFTSGGCDSFVTVADDAKSSRVGVRVARLWLDVGAVAATSRNCDEKRCDGEVGKNQYQDRDCDELNLLGQSPHDAAFLGRLLAATPPGVIGAVRVRAGAPALSVPALLGANGDTKLVVASAGLTCVDAALMAPLLSQHSALVYLDLSNNPLFALPSDEKRESVMAGTADTGHPEHLKFGLPYQ